MATRRRRGEKQVGEQAHEQAHEKKQPPQTDGGNGRAHRDETEQSGRPGSNRRRPAWEAPTVDPFATDGKNSKDLAQENLPAAADLVHDGGEFLVQSGPNLPSQEKAKKFRKPFADQSKENLAIAQAAKRLALNSNDAAAIAALVQGVIAALSRKPGQRKSGRAISVPKRIAQLLNTYAPALSTSARADLRARCAIRAEELGLPSELQQVSKSATLADAAMHLGLTARQLARRLADPEYRRDLGWPRPLGGDVIFARAVLDPRSAAEYLSSCPAREPWPQKSWPEGWR
ncbi:MAG TPA: hypothetical protein VII66_08060 [Gemmatimonadaceae bacterium]